MPTIRCWSSALAAAAMLLTLAPAPAHADVDMTGRWRRGLPGLALANCLDIVQTGTQLDVHRCDGSGFPFAGSLGSAEGAFAWEEDSVTRAIGTVSPDGRTFAGTVFVYHCTFVGCAEIPFDMFGSRCGGGTVDPGEQCDVGAADGSQPTGTCCTTECTFAPEGTTCEADADPMTDDACNADGVCLPVPPPTCGPCLVWDPSSEACKPDVRTDCRRPLANLARVAMTTRSPDAADAVTWMWTGVSSTAAADFGDPRAATALETCIFADDSSGGVALVHAAVVPPGGTCGTRPCWSASGAGTTYRYRNRRGDGMRSVKLVSATNGTATIRLRGKGAGLGLPTTFADVLPPVTVQVRRGDAPICWEARFSALKMGTASRLYARDGQ